MKRRRLAALLGALALTFSVGTTAFATSDAKVTICHATDSNSNPYVNPNVNISSSGHLQGGHDTEHLGPIWPATKADGKWGDIIPPYDFQPDEGPLFVYPRSQLDRRGPGDLEQRVQDPQRDRPRSGHPRREDRVGRDPASGRRPGDLHVRRHEHRQRPADGRLGLRRQVLAGHLRQRRHGRRRQARPDRVVDVHLHGDDHRRHDEHRDRDRPRRRRQPSPTMTPRP